MGGTNIDPEVSIPFHIGTPTIVPLILGNPISAQGAKVNAPAETVAAAARTSLQGSKATKVMKECILKEIQWPLP